MESILVPTQSIYTTIASLIVFVLVVKLLLSPAYRPTSFENPGNVYKLEDLKSLGDQHETGSVLSDLVEKDGAGAWPPYTDHESWPPALQPYKGIYLELVPLLPAEPSTDDSVHEYRRQKYQGLMRKLLSERIDIAEVEGVMGAFEAQGSSLRRDAYNGFYCCIAVCRHAYRWATIPIGKVAQQEKFVDLPPELEAPWPYLQRNFGVTADSGNKTANVLLNFDKKGQRIYKINVGMPDLITSSEEAFFRMFYDLEVLAFPIYLDMVGSLISFDNGDEVLCAKHLRSIALKAREVFTMFYQKLTESFISKKVWLSYVQGFQGWGAGRIIDQEYVEFDGLSANQVLFFQALDAFLGLDPYLSDENMLRYIPITQRKFCSTLRKHSLRKKLQAYPLLEIEIQKIVKSLRGFRAVHRARWMSYMKQPAPERLTMTAGLSVLEGPTSEDTEENIENLDKMLLTRLTETM